MFGLFGVVFSNNSSAKKTGVDTAKSGPSKGGETLPIWITQIAARLLEASRTSFGLPRPLQKPRRSRRGVSGLRRWCDLLHPQVYFEGLEGFPSTRTVDRFSAGHVGRVGSAFIRVGSQWARGVSFWNNAFPQHFLSSTF